MKQSGVIVTVVISAAVLLSAYGAGLAIRHVRMRRAASEKKQPVAPQQVPEVRRVPIPERVSKPMGRPLSEQEQAKLREAREQLRQRWENMSEEERRQFRDQMGRRFRVEGPRGMGRFGNLSPEERRRLEEQRRRMRERWEQMSEQEREQFRRQMQERFDRWRREPGAPPTDMFRPMRPDVNAPPRVRTDTNQTSPADR